MQGDAKVMRTQLDYLIKVSRRPNIQLQVLPFKTHTYHGALVSYRFTILRVPSPGVAGPLEVVYIDQLVDDRYLEDKPECVEVAGTLAAVRDSKNPNAILTVDLRPLLASFRLDR